jgi:pyridoxamine 5'-phosphate oxidase
MYSDPIEFFSALYQQYRNAGVSEPSAVTLATATPTGKPSARVVLLKAYDVSGFVFFSNLGSRKSRELAANPQAALCFYWEAIGYQIRIEGRTERIPDPEADNYFVTRPRGSQIGAWASRQSETLSSREALENRVRAFESRFLGVEVPRPDFWSGFRVDPDRMEFWQQRSNRLHERTLYTKQTDGWHCQLLYP